MKLITTPRSGYRYVSPFSSLFGLDRDLDQLLAAERTAYVPALDVREDVNAVTVQVELPGVARENVQVTFHDGVLTVSGERKAENEAKEDGWYHRERVYGRFERHVTVNTPVNADQVRASHKDGVLTITLPKTAEAKPRQIEISSN
jgi:HSP20 family protein